MKLPLQLVPMIILVAACHKDTDIILQEEQIPDPPEIMITTRLVTMVDTQDAVTDKGEIYFHTLWQDLDGFPFSIMPSVMINQSHTTQTWKTAGGMNLHQVTSLVPNDINYTHWSLPQLQELQLSTENTFDDLISQGLRLKISAGPLMTADSLQYSGSYTLSYARVFTPKAPSPAIPTYTALTVDQGPQSLLFRECIFIHISATSGEPLQFITPAHLAYENPHQDDPWVFDAGKGAWIFPHEQMEKDEMSIFSPGYYAWAEPVAMTHLSGKLLINQTPAAHTTIMMEYGDQVRPLYSTQSGHWSIQLPAGIPSTVTLKLPCAEVLAQQFTTPTTPQEAQNLSWTVSDLTPLRIQGIVRDCQANPIQENFLFSQAIPNGFLFSANADVDLQLLACGASTFSLHTTNPLTGEEGPDIPWPTKDTLQVGSLFACEAAKQEYLFLHVAGDQKMYWELSSQKTQDNRLLIKHDDMAGGLEFSVYISGMEEGLYADQMLNILFEDMQLGSRGYSLYCPTATTGCGFTSFEITHFPEQQGSWIRGSFEGRFWIKTFHPLTAGYRTVKGEFQVYREF